jgi:hypothetical protein
MDKNQALCNICGRNERIYMNKYAYNVHISVII